jgi:hypothetical protein
MPTTHASIRIIRRQRAPRLARNRKGTRVYPDEFSISGDKPLLVLCSGLRTRTAPPHPSRVAVAGAKKSTHPPSPFGLPPRDGDGRYTSGEKLPEQLVVGTPGKVWTLINMKVLPTDRLKVMKPTQAAPETHARNFFCVHEYRAAINPDTRCDPPS